MSYTYGAAPAPQLTFEQQQALQQQTFTQQSSQQQQQQAYQLQQQAQQQAAQQQAANVQALTSGIIQIPREFGPADLQLQAPKLQSGTGPSQIILIFGVLGLSVALMYIFFNMFKI